MSRWLIDNWRQALRFWSVRLNAVGALIMGLVFWSPDAVLILWNMLPDAVADRLPQHIVTMVGAVLFAVAILARVVDQEKVKPGKGKSHEKN
ncbi:DUF7940 domain-containing protein [Pacificimonas sp. ICDLI1SI03]